MQRNKQIWILVLVVIVATVVTSVASFQTQGQDTPNLMNQNQKVSSEQEKRKKEIRAEIKPVAGHGTFF